ncbi:uncharacterized protein LOC119839040 [Zerene cesonia]|uniref:uncharacterized protein LOC119839040 n=1 Tax=Zerene cesonia TaxID=33412 RepID=UPI0018E5969A|nr:uncharacterized protein LOC119839040 [Zerene cesonia]
MLKITAILSLFLIGTAVWAQGLSCDSCGSECASACGTRHFRSCCFNYLRKKRPDTMNVRYYSGGTRPNEIPTYAEDMPDVRFAWLNDKLQPNMEDFYDRD